jgi:Zn-dependent protease
LRDELITSLAGPGMNLLLATIGMLLMMSYAKITGTALSTLLMGNFDLVTLFRFMFITVNLALAVFNLLPIFPLDGYRLVKIFRKKGAQRMEKNAILVSLILLGLILLPGVGLIGKYVSTVSDALYRILFTLFSLIFY